MEVKNPSFETAGAGYGLAADWTEFQSGGAEDVAPFWDADRALDYEGFEGAWENNQFALWAFPSGGLVAAAFEYGTEPQETFDSSWVEPGVLTSPPVWNHQSYTAYDYPSGLYGYFDVATPEPVEDFEEEWLSNETAVTDFLHATGSVASFDVVAPEDFEDFDEEWLSNETAVVDYIHAGETIAVFDSALVPENFEDFEEGWTEAFV